MTDSLQPGLVLVDWAGQDLDCPRPQDTCEARTFDIMLSAPDLNTSQLIRLHCTFVRPTLTLPHARMCSVATATTHHCDTVFPTSKSHPESSTSRNAWARGLFPELFVATDTDSKVGSHIGRALAEVLRNEEKGFPMPNRSVDSANRCRHVEKDDDDRSTSSPWGVHVDDYNYLKFNKSNNCYELCVQCTSDGLDDAVTVRLTLPVPATAFVAEREGSCVQMVAPIAPHLCSENTHTPVGTIYFGGKCSDPRTLPISLCGGYYTRTISASSLDEAFNTHNCDTRVGAWLNNDASHFMYSCPRGGTWLLSRSSSTLRKVSPFAAPAKGSHSWCSPATFVDYPTSLTSEQEGVVQLEVTLDEPTAGTHTECQSLLLYSVGGGALLSSAKVRGTVCGVEGPVEGTGLVRCHRPRNLTKTRLDDRKEGLLRSVAGMVNKLLRGAYPLDGAQMTPTWVRRNVFGPRHAMPQINPQHISDAVFRPVRELIDRGGKSWRSLILVAVAQAVMSRTSQRASDGSAVDHIRFMLLPELVHVGSLMIDDIEDGSLTRRGGQCVHLKYGLPHAINAGTACYFFAPQLSGVPSLPPAQQLELYNLFFDFLRCGHVGQGLDIDGLHKLMPAAVETGDVSELRALLDTIHQNKTGGFVATVCRMGGVIVGADTDVQEHLDRFGMEIGFAFQVVDDALNMTGFEGNLKEACEDIREGKVTYPILSALERLPRDKREEMWGILRDQSTTTASTSQAEEGEEGGVAMVDRVRRVIELVHSVHAVEECLAEARSSVDKAWRDIDGVIPDSLPKLIIRAFTLFLVDRTL
eukprot:PhM_4_TR5411/c0_g1_i1/m.14277